MLNLTVKTKNKLYRNSSRLFRDYKRCSSVISIPPTQAGGERLFSVLKLIKNRPQCFNQGGSCRSSAFPKDSQL